MARPINPRQIEAFRAVILTGSMTAGGEMLHISQPAISRLIRALEADLDLELFERNGAHIAPTDEALILYQDVERLFVGGERIREAAAAIRNRSAGTLRIAAMPNVSLGYFPRIIQEFLVDHPGISVVLHSDASVNIIDLVAKNQFNVGLAYVPTDQPGVEIHPLPIVDAVCVLPLDHPLADRPVIHAQDLEGLDFITLGQSSLLRMHIATAIQSANVECNSHIETRYASTACAFVARGLGVAIVDPFVVVEVGKGDVVAKPFRPRIPYEFSLIYPRRRPNSGIAEEFGEMFRKAMERDFG
ncbi:MAG: LysR family transcriptional regulator [Rhodospirillales bacterium]|jgi:DNA-binding transcriptional LysR family regulator|nr:LysR family transcriptional regulator [Rhodospirillales bacterium]